VLCAGGDTDARYLPSQHGRDTPIDPMKMMPGALSGGIALAPGETIDKVDCRLFRALAIEGRVTNDAGDPIAGAQVSIISTTTDYVAGFGANRETDDQGRYRLFGLPPGEYLVSAFPRSATNSSLTGVNVRPVTTYYPSTASQSEAQRIRLTADEVLGIDIRVRVSRTHSISGIALDSSGAPITTARGRVKLTVRDVRSSSSFAASQRPDGRFEARDLIPGDYEVTAEVGGRGQPVTEFGRVALKLDTEDIQGIVLTSSPAARIKGTIAFDPVPPERPDLRRSAVEALIDAKATRPLGMSHEPNWVRADGTFELGELFGAEIIRIGNLPQGWSVKEIRYRNEDITDRPVDFSRHPPSDVRIVLTTEGAQVRGRVLDQKGQPVRNARVVMFSTDPERWNASLTSSAIVATDENGAYAITGRRPGDYLVAAVAEFPMITNNFASAVKALADKAERVSLQANEQRTLDLTLVTKDE
jgi:protocatechuate 3,4-dioxygenase beta subunit